MPFCPHGPWHSLTQINRLPGRGLNFGLIVPATRQDDARAAHRVLRRAAQERLACIFKALGSGPCSPAGPAPCPRQIVTSISRV